MGCDAVILGTSRRRGSKGGVVEIVAAKGEGASEMSRCNLDLVSSSRRAADEIGTMKQASKDLLHEIRQIQARLAEIVEAIVLADSSRSMVAKGSDLCRLVEAGFDPMILRGKPDLYGLWKAEDDLLIEALVKSVSIEIPDERVSIFVGPSGSGKTTSTLKVAGSKIRLGQKPTVVELDPNGSRKSDLVKDQARRLGAKPLRIARATDIEKIINGKAMAILVDTPGLSEISDEDLRFLADLCSRHAEVRMHLVIDAGLDAQNVCAIASCIPQVPRLGMVLTKLDETSRIGGALSASIETGLPLTYVTGGTRPTDGIFIPTHDLILEKVSESLKRD